MDFTLRILPFIFLFLLSCTHLSAPTRQLASLDTTDSFTQLALWETTANGAGERSAELFDLEHYEIPLRYLSQDLAEGLDPRIRDSLIFEKDGEAYVRWVVNPEDTVWRYDIEEFLRAKNLSAEYHTYFKGHLTASRSVLVHNPANGAKFSLKVSTNMTAGIWRDKRQGWDDAKQIRQISDMAKTVTEKMKLTTAVFMEEPMAMGIPELEQAFVVRSLNDVPENKFFYLPAFSAIHEAEGARIAKLNGAENIADFWNENLNRPLARALAEFAAYTGFTYDSPHSQNFLVELDLNYKPTGRIVLRDFGDSYLSPDFIENTVHRELLLSWPRHNIMTNHFNMSIGLTNGNTTPEWLKDSIADWGDDFFDEFEEKFSKITGVSLENLQSRRIGEHSNFDYAFHKGYFRKKYLIGDPSWKEFFKQAPCFSGAPIDIERCNSISIKNRIDLSCSTLLYFLL